MTLPRVLIIEDDVDFATSLQAALAVSQFAADIVVTGEEGVERFISNSFIVTITDIKLPGFDGFEVVRRIKNIDKDAQVVVMTGFRDKELIDRAWQVGASKVLLKPFRLIELISLINNLYINSGR